MVLLGVLAHIEGGEVQPGGGQHLLGDGEGTVGGAHAPVAAQCVAQHLEVSLQLGAVAVVLAVDVPLPVRIRSRVACSLERIAPSLSRYGSCRYISCWTRSTSDS